MQNKIRVFEEQLLKKIEEGNGSIYQIMVLSQEYNIDFKKINKIIDKHVGENKITWAGNRFIIKDE